MVDFHDRDSRRSLEGLGDGEDDEDEGEHADDEGDHDDEHAGGEHHEHEHDDHHAHDLAALGIAVLTVSSSRTIDQDESGDAIVSAVEGAGHEVVTRELVGDDHDRIQGVVDTLAGRNDVDAVISTGGTGVTPDDVTVEAVEPLFEKDLPGFGELFRRRSYEEIGTHVVATRATAGIADGVPVFCLPGSRNAVQLGVEEIVLSVAGHLAGLARREG